MYKNRIGLRAAFVAAGCISVLASQDSGAIAARKLDQTPVAELGAVAATLVAKADASDRQAVALASLDAVMKRRPAAATTVVASMVRKSPQLAAKLVARASQLSPDRAAEFAYSAANAAPDQVGAVLDAVRVSSPKSVTATELRLADFMVEPNLRLASSEATAEATATPEVEVGNRASSGGVIVFQKPKAKPPQQSASGTEAPGTDYARP